MNVVFRVDGNTQIGTGHIMRCLALVKGLHDANITFICQNDSKYLEGLITPSGIDVLYLPDSVPAAKPEALLSAEGCWRDALATEEVIENLGAIDWLIVDHYGIDIRWEEILVPVVNKIMVIDDLANRPHACDVLLDQNYYTNAETRYDDLLPKDCIKLLGPSYALLRDEFSKTPKCVVKERVKNILISFGGSDEDDFTGNILNVLSDSEYKDITINVIMGIASKHKNAVENICKDNSNMQFHYQINYMAKLMSEADFFIGAGGSTSWERLALGLPSIVIAIADNQIELCKNLAQTNLIDYIGTKGDFTPKHFKKCFDKNCNDFKWRKEVNTNGMALVDGRGVKKVAAYLKSFALELRPAEAKDCEDIYKWRTAPSSRKFSNNKDDFTFESHEAWYKNILTSGDSNLLVAYKGDEPLGVVRFDYSANEALISLYLVPGWHNKGWGGALLLSAGSWLDKNHSDIQQIKAEIISGNIASEKIFIDDGFVKTSGDKKSILLVKEIGG